LLNIILRSSLVALSAAALLAGTSATHTARADRPSLVVSDDAPPEVVYRKGSRDGSLDDFTPVTESRTFSAASSSAAPSRAPGRHVETLVTRKANELARELSQQQNDADNFQDRLIALQSKSDALASEYYAHVAAINTELQAGTTAGNPVLTERWNDAQEKLEKLSQGASQLNNLATDVSAAASKSAYLQESVRATYGLSGAMQEDHKRLQQIEDDANRNIVSLNRMMTSVNDEINRRTSYLRAENLNMQTLSLAIANGELYGRNVSNSLFKRAAEDGRDMFGGAGGAPAAVPAQKRPLVVIRFDKPNVNYKQAVYTAVSQALEKYPAARFDLVAVSPSQGNPAQMALAGAEARKNGEGVLRSLTQMGLPLERIRLNAANSKDVQNNEVHIFIQ
jgi:hypothetical protein